MIMQPTVTKIIKRGQPQNNIILETIFGNLMQMLSDCFEYDKNNKKKKTRPHNPNPVCPCLYETKLKLSMK